MTTDVWIPRLVVVSVAALGLSAMVGAVLMVNPPAWFASIAVGALTGLIGYLVPSPIQPRPPAIMK